jgi:protein-arginine kinase activator protein McsA
MKDCTKCKLNKSLIEFNRSSKNKDGRHSWCKLCRKKYDKIFYQINKPRITLRNRQWDFRIREKIKNYLTIHPCVDCGIKDIRVLEFDHVTGIKLFNISSAVGAGCSWKKIKNEISKCEVRCANCHRIKTVDRRNH